MRRRAKPVEPRVFILMDSFAILTRFSVVFDREFPQGLKPRFFSEPLRTG